MVNKKASELLSSIKSLPVGWDELNSIAERMGCIIMSYNRGRDIIHRLGLDPSKEQPSFYTTTEDGTRIIFYYDMLTPKERQFYIAHEIGHIALHHTYINDCKSIDAALRMRDQEEEADAFALALLAPPDILLACHCKNAEDIAKLTGLDTARARLAFGAMLQRKGQPSDDDTQTLLKQFAHFIRRHKMHRIRTAEKLLASLCIILSIALTACICVGASIATSFDLVPKGTTVDKSAYVWISENGTKYHTRTCYHLDKADHVERVTLGEAIEQGYGMCLDCKPYQ